MLNKQHNSNKKITFRTKENVENCGLTFNVHFVQNVIFCNIKKIHLYNHSGWVFCSLFLLQPFLRYQKPRLLIFLSLSN